MKMVMAALLILSFGFVHAQDVQTGNSVTTPSSGVEEGRPSHEQRKAMKEELKDERDAVTSACQEEAKAANCGDKSAGRGLLKCIHGHKKESKDFKISESCKTAMKALRSERKKVKRH